MDSLIQTRKIRNSNFEVLRLVCMLLIIFSHYFVHGILPDSATTPISTGNVIVLNSFCVFGNIAVLVFMLISGYFMSSSKFQFTKFLKLLLEYIFYSVVLYLLIQVIILKDSFSIKSFIKALIPFYESGSPNWFMRAYLILYLFTPFINFFITRIGKDSFLTILILIIAIWYVFPMISAASFEVNDLLCLTSAYLVGAYIRKYPLKQMTKRITWISFAIVFPLYLSGMVGFQLLARNGGSWSILSSITSLVSSKNSIISLYLAINIFSIAFTAKPFYSKIINFFSASALGIYLIHDNLFFRDYLWHEIFAVQNQSENNLLIFNLLWVSLTIFFGCLLIDIFRRYALELPIFKLFEKPIKKVETFCASKTGDIS